MHLSKRSCASLTLKPAKTFRQRRHRRGPAESKGNLEMDRYRYMPRASVTLSKNARVTKSYKLLELLA